MRAAVVLVAGALAVGACSGGDDSRAVETTTTTEAVVPVGDGSAFCDAMIAVGQVSPQGETPAEVLAATNALAAQLDEAEASLPEDSPVDLAALLDDYRVAVTAINAAGGDITKAYAALPADVVARLGSATSHEKGYDYLVERCGIAAPG
jgi:hypothetical protein